MDMNVYFRNVESKDRFGRLYTGVIAVLVATCLLKLNHRIIKLEDEVKTLKSAKGE